MGGCFGGTTKKRQTVINYTRIHVDELIDQWSAGQVIMIKDRIHTFCERKNKQRMNKTMFVEFFPMLHELFPDKFHTRIFNFFDWDNDSYLTRKQIVIGLSVILKLQKSKLAEIFFNLYKDGEQPFQTKYEFNEFTGENRKLLKNKPNNIDTNTFSFVTQSQFVDYFCQNYDLTMLQNVFNSDANEGEERLIELLKSNNCKIELLQGATMFIVDYKWFDSWRKYAEMKFKLENTISFSDQKANNFKARYTSVTESIMFRTAGQNKIFLKPRPIDNSYLEGDFAGQLRQGMQLYQDYVFVPENLWRCLKDAYGGGPEFKRRYPQAYPLTLNRVSIDKNGQFESECQKIMIIDRNQILKNILLNQPIETAAYKRNIGDETWTKLNLDKSISDNEIYSQSFICIVGEQQKKFLSNYCEQPRKKPSFGDWIYSNIYQEATIGYVMEMNEKQVVVYYRNQPTESRTIIEKKEFMQSSKRKDTIRIVAGLRNLGNSCYMNSVIQCILASPVLSDFLIKQKFTRYVSEDAQKKQLVVRCLSELSKNAHQNPNKVQKPVQLRRTIVSSMPMFDNYDQQDAQEFLCQFLNCLSEEVSSTKVNIVNSIDASQEHFQEYSIIKKFFAGDEIRRIKCLKCQNQITRKQATFSLKLPVPEINHVFLFANYYPSRNSETINPIVKYAVKLSKTSTFGEAAQKLSIIIDKPLKKLVFAIVQFGQIRFFISDYEFHRKIQDFRISEFQSIFIYDENYSISEAEKYLPKIVTKGRKTPSFPNNLIDGDIVDVYNWTEWQIGIFRSIDTETRRIKCETYEGEVEFPFQKFSPFLSKTLHKDPVRVSVIHRKYNSRRDRPECFSLPFIVHVGQWMNWNDIVDIINHEAERFVDRKYYEMMGDTPNPDGPQFRMVESQISQKSGTDIITRKRKESDAFLQNRSHASQSIKHQSAIFRQEGEPKAEVRSNGSSLLKNAVPYKIKILNRSSETCCFCNCYTRIDGQITKNKYGYTSDNLCQGCSAKEKQPIGMMLDLRKIIFSLDWNDTLAFKTDAIRSVSDESHTILQQEMHKEKNTLAECLQLYAHSEEQVELRCQKCGHQKSLMSTKMNKTPSLLVVHLKRFQYVNGYMKKMDNRIEAPFQINLNMISDEKLPDNKYELYGITCHDGSGFAGHYYSYVFKNKKTWVKCDDDVTSIVNFNSIRLSSVYLLFYRKINMASSLLAL